jgi:hypothetical protein
MDVTRVTVTWRGERDVIPVTRGANALAACSQLGFKTQCCQKIAITVVREHFKKPVKSHDLSKFDGTSGEVVEKMVHANQAQSIALLFAFQPTFPGMKVVENVY